MANNLTGEFEAVFLVRVRQINGILATMHHSRVSPSPAPGFPHSIERLRVGTAPFVSADDTRFLEWSVNAATHAVSTATPQVMRQLLSDKSPPGVAAFYQEAWTRLDAAMVQPAPSSYVHGEADVQISNPTVSFSPDAPSSVTVHVHIRARYKSAPNSTSLPEFIHGEVRARYVAYTVPQPNGRIILRVEVSNDDGDITFVANPSSGASPQDVKKIAEQVRSALRKSFKALDVELPIDFGFSEFGTIGSGDDAAVVLPFRVTGSPPAGALGSIVNSFLDNAEFAVAVSKERIDTYMDDVIDFVKVGAAMLKPILSSPLGTAVYDVTIENLAFTWKAGGIDISGRANLTSEPWWAPDGWIRFTQRVTIALDAAKQLISVQAVGGPTVDESLAVPHDLALTEVTNSISGALPIATATLHSALDGARQRLITSLRSFDSFGTANYTGVQVTPDGVILRGTIGTGGRVAPIVHVDETDNGKAFTALHTWIPGGHIQTFNWTWVEWVHPIPWANETSKKEDSQTFICAKQPSMQLANRVCLQVVGTRRSGDGFLETDITGGEICSVSSHEPVLVVPPWAFEAVVPVWRVDPPADAVMNDMIVAHVNLAGDRRPVGELAPNVVVHFTGHDFRQPLAELSRVLGRTRRPEAALMVFLVVPRGTFRSSRRELEARLGEVSRDFPASLSITEDYGGGWSRIFGVRSEVASTHIVNARGEAAWSEEGAFDPERLSHVLHEHLLPAAPPRHRLLRTNITAGTDAPDVLLTGVDGNQLSLRRLHGRPVALVFWQSWSEPSLRELQRLEDLRRRGGPHFVVAINGGESRETIEQIRKQYGFTIALFEDAGRVVAARYGVCCWPTTIVVAPNGLVERVHAGIVQASEPAKAD